LASHQRNI